MKREYPAFLLALTDLRKLICPFQFIPQAHSQIDNNLPAQMLGYSTPEEFVVLYFLPYDNLYLVL